MTEDMKCLRILKEGVSLSDVFKEDFLDNLDENFGDFDVFPVGIAFAVQKEDITEDMINLTYRDDNDIQDNIIVIDVGKNPEHMDKILNSFK